MAKNLNFFISRIRAKLKHGSFIHNVVIMFMGTALGQLSTVLLSPVLTRIYLPDLFGILGFFTAFITILSVIASLRYDMALPLAKSKEEAANMLGVCFVSLVATTMFFLVCTLLLPSSLFGVLAPYRFLLPLGFFCIGAYQVMIGYATWHGSFAAIARTKIYQGVSSPLTQIGLGLMGSGAWGLIIGYIVGQSAGVSNMLYRLVLKPTDVISNIKRDDMLALAKRYSRFPLISTWSALVNAISSSSLMLVVLPILYSNTVAGFVFLTDRIIGRPLLLISTSILQVYIGEAAKTQSSDPRAMRKRFLQVLKTQFVIVASWLALINSTAFYFVPLVFGREWAGAVVYINILSISYLPHMTMIAVANTLQILEKQGLVSMWEFSRFILVIGGFLLSYLLALSPEQAMLIYSCSQGAMQVILFCLMYHQIQKIQPN